MILTKDWATAEAMALGTLIQDGVNVRLCGQDVGRGTFSQRHLKFYCQETGEKYEPLSHVENIKGSLEIVPSPLSELAVLGFEYGYTIDNPNNLSIWEAQFGDFSLNAMAVIDQFICCGEDKWATQSSLVMLLPHGFDGAGPEHSSARIERYLQLCDGEVNTNEEEQLNCNMFVVNCTTPANYFHVLRRQMVNNYRKPLIVFSPKTLLRHSKAVSPISDLDIGTQFQPIISEEKDSNSVDQIIICSGKLYYELIEERKKKNLEDSVVIIRLEQMSPFPYKQLQSELSKFKNAKVMKYVQEEPENMGAYLYVKSRFERFEKQFNKNLKYVGRKPLSSPAVGISKIHKQEVAKLYQEAFE
jgi:probable 2-oxoglutarate dehydrogenase E1 component DHKTD1